MRAQALADVALMRHVCAERLQEALLQENTTEPEVRTLVPEEARALLDCVRIANAHIARHVRDSEALDGKSAVHRLSTHEDPWIGVLPRHRWRDRTRVDLQDLCLTYRVFEFID